MFVRKGGEFAMLAHVGPYLCWPVLASVAAPGPELTGHAGSRQQAAWQAAGRQQAGRQAGSQAGRQAGRQAWLGLAWLGLVWFGLVE